MIEQGDVQRCVDRSTWAIRTKAVPDGEGDGQVDLQGLIDRVADDDDRFRVVVV